MVPSKAITNRSNGSMSVTRSSSSGNSRGSTNASRRLMDLEYRRELEAHLVRLGFR